MCSKCVYVDWEGRSLLPGNSPKTNREQDNDPQASAKMLRLLVSHWGFPRQQKKVKPLWADSDTSPGEGPRYDFCIIQRRSGTTCRGTEISEAFSEVKCWKWFAHVATEQGLPSDKTDAMMTSLMLSNHRAPDQLSSHVEHVKQRRGTWCIWLQASDWPLQPLCGEMKSFSCSLCSQLWCSVFFPSPPFCGASNCSLTASVQHITHIHIHRVGYVSHLFSIDQRLLWRGSQMYRDLGFKQLCEEVSCLKGDVPGVTIVCGWRLSSCCNLLDCNLWFPAIPRMICNTPQRRCELVALSFMNTEASEARAMLMMEWRLVHLRLKTVNAMLMLMCSSYITFCSTEAPAGVHVVIWFMSSCLTAQHHFSRRQKLG